MSRSHALSLSDQQLKLVEQHARALPLGLRDKYLRAIADRLVGVPTNDAVMAAINHALDVVHAFLNNGGIPDADQNPNNRRRSI